jgi:hypothetical protein
MNIKNRGVMFFVLANLNFSVNQMTKKSFTTFQSLASQMKHHPS